MKKIIGQYIANIRQKFLVWCIRREIEQNIFSQLDQKKSCGYPFGSSPEELETLSLFGKADAQVELALIEKGIERMPKTFGNAFRFIMYRDLNARIKMYAQFARKFNLRKPMLEAPQKPLEATA